MAKTVQNNALRLTNANRGGKPLLAPRYSEQHLRIHQPNTSNLAWTDQRPNLWSPFFNSLWPSRNRRCVIQIRPFPWVHMGHKVQYPVTLQNTLPGADGNVVASLDRERRIDLDMGVNNNHVAHLARAHIVHTSNARGFHQRAADGFDLRLVRGTIHQVVQRVPSESPTHSGDHEPNYQGCDRV